MSDATLADDNKLGIRLLSVTFPDARTASVVFELFSDGYNVGPPRQPLLTLRQEAPLYKLDVSGLPDYNGIVEAAAKKLESDFRRVMETLAETYPPH